MIMVIDYNFVNQFWKQCWLLLIDYYLLVIDYQRVKLFGKIFFWKILLNKIVLFILFLKNSFNTYLDWVFSWFLNLESWFYTWILNLDLDYSWIMNLESWSWFLKLAWLLILWHHQNNLRRHCFHRLLRVGRKVITIRGGKTWNSRLVIMYSWESLHGLGLVEHWNPKNSHLVLSVLSKFLKESIMWHTKLHYPRHFLIFTMSFMCLKSVSISMIHLMWSNWMTYK